MGDLRGKDILTAEQFSREEIWSILGTAERLEYQLEGERSLDLLRGYLLATLFFEPSTRTRLSFEAAMHRLGGEVISVAQAKTASSAAKGESLADTAHTLEQYCDLMVIRHPQIGS
ncbi:MAG: aspartate carbamoyltransferase, partial [Anaerolineae bacterium]|nr:aspartate carbamoyltransferase [Anaerolineae bacterium]